MQLTPEALSAEGEDGGLIHFVDTAFFASNSKRVGVAVSGGGDSMAVLHVAARWSVLRGVPIAAVTVDHGLREEAAEEARMVASVCATLGVPHDTLHWDGRSATGNIAAAGRDARYRLIANWARANAVDGVLLGHTEDDVAETFLMRLARKSGVDGLSVMDVRFRRNGVDWARPFWQQSRAELREYLRRHDVPWVEDPTNGDEAYDRPKARKALAALAPLGIAPETLKSVAVNMTGASGALEHYAFEEARRLVRLEAGDVILPRRPRPPIPPEIERRLHIAAVRFIGQSGYPPRYKSMVDLKAGLTLAGKHTLGGCVVTQDATTLRFTREYNAVRDLVTATDAVWDARWALDGPHDPALQVRALGDHLSEVPDWRATGLPRDSLRVTPAVFQGEALVAAPVAGLQNGWTARIVADFGSFLVSR